MPWITDLFHGTKTKKGMRQWNILKCGWSKTGLPWVSMPIHINCIFSSNVMLSCFPSHLTFPVSSHAEGLNLQEYNWRFESYIATGHLWWRLEIFHATLWTLVEVCNCWRTIFWGQLCIKALGTTRTLIWLLFQKFLKFLYIINDGF
jgi:hypothetical protein